MTRRLFNSWLIYLERWNGPRFRAVIPTEPRFGAMLSRRRSGTGKILAVLRSSAGRPVRCDRSQVGAEEDRFGPESESRLQGFYEDDDDDDPAAPAPRG